MGELAFRHDFGGFAGVAVLDFGEHHEVLVGFGGVVAALDVEFQEPVEKDFGGFRPELFGTFVGGNAYAGVEQLRFRHLRSHGTFPDEVVKGFLLGGAVDERILYECGAYCFVGFLRALAVGLELSGVGVLLSESFDDELPGGPEGQGGKIGGVGTHIGDETLFVKALGHPHGLAYREAKFARGFLLKGGGGEGRRREAGTPGLLHALHMVNVAYAVVEELFGLLGRLEAGVQGAFDGCGTGLEPELAFNPVIRLVPECHDFPLAVHHKPQGDALHPPCGETPVDLLPEYWGEFEPDQPVQHAPRLLGVHQVHVEFAGVEDGFPDGVPGDFVEGYPPGAALVQPKCFHEVP